MVYLNPQNPLQVNVNHALLDNIGAPINNFQNNVGQLTLPNTFYPTFTLGLDNFTVPITPMVTSNDNGEIKPQNINQSPLGIDLGGYPIECLVLGFNCPDSALGNAIAATSNVFKKLGLILLALVLLSFGLYLIGKQSDTVQGALKVAKSV